MFVSVMAMLAFTACGNDDDPKDIALMKPSPCA